MSFRLNICVIGVGYVGEHLVDTFKNKYTITGVDLDEKRVAFLKNKFKNINNINIQSSYSNLEHIDVFLISVPTLIQNGNVDLSYLYNVKKSIENIVKVGSLIVVESSVYVGATREIFGDWRKRGIYIGFSPERVDPGRIEPKMEDIPKIISGIDESSLHKIKSVYSKVIKNTVPVSSTECAEMCKLYENCFRMVNIAYVNEISDMCKTHDINPYEMIDASSTKPFGFMPFYPSLGVGGHCIPVNPYYLFKNGNLPVLQLSTVLMEARPKRIAYNILKNHNDKNNILICGLGFKKDQGLLTNSPGFELLKHLQSKKNIVVFDPYVSKIYPYNDIQFISEDKISDTLLSTDLVVVVHPYLNKYINEYKKIGGEVLWYSKEYN